MKKYIIFLFFSLFSSFILLSQTSNYKVTFWIHEIEDSTIYVYGSYGEKENLLLDSLQMREDGSFILEGEFRQGILLITNSFQKLFSFILDKNPVFSIEIYPHGYYEVKGCEENKHYLEYQKINSF